MQVCRREHAARVCVHVQPSLIERIGPNLTNPQRLSWQAHAPLALVLRRKAARVMRARLRARHRKVAGSAISRNRSRVPLAGPAARARAHTASRLTGELFYYMYNVVLRTGACACCLQVVRRQKSRPCDSAPMGHLPTFGLIEVSSARSLDRSRGAGFEHALHAGCFQLARANAHAQLPRANAHAHTQFFFFSMR